VEAVQRRVSNRPDGCYARFHIARHDVVGKQNDDQNTLSLLRTKPIPTRGYVRQHPALKSGISVMANMQLL
jgi:hypothetical protein